ncbi:Structural maintenance of chromosomes protein [Meloidogyne graminicola]|uniref:Structural maintenance of chromosomes protein n=1 Tax=Meloidogyne graminicola TaxID=189291 RepID=A0A8S9ZSW9_9BILA|nr:Structural maintenance of chromosomes protein [Meloidogyne graminicola]
MRIKKIEIEGFKSYSQREVVDKLDPQFNAITGLNGSGKSNILDAICFLLGITNLVRANVRAHTLTDLVYKQGQAGINRATVTIVFDNSDQQPAGYNKCKEIVVRRQIIINGRNTYQINGTIATNQRVSDLFRMVGINVNNPHFLIMQGRITKVLGMKPLEILSMLEEAAGVRMYECKKQNAIRIIEKKDSKVEEINRLFDEDIFPRVERLKKDRENYLEYQRIERELELFERKFTAYDYHNSQLQIKELEKKSQTFRQRIKEIEEEITQLQEEAKREEQTLQKMEAERAKNVAPELQKLEKSLKEKQNSLAKIESEKDGKEANLNELHTSIKRKNESLISDRQHLETKKKQLDTALSENGNVERSGLLAEEAVQRARQKLEALARGMTTDEMGNAVTLEEQLIATRTKLSEQQTNLQKLEMQITQSQKILEKKRLELNSFKRRSTGGHETKRKLETDIAKIEEELNSLNFNPELEKNLENERRRLCHENDELTREIDTFEARYFNLQFNYKNPYDGFDRKNVKGVVAKLFKLKDPKFATALEVVGGGRVEFFVFINFIYNIVVNKAEIAKILIDKKCIQNRVTMLPMDKIEVRGVVSQSQIQEAKRMVGEDNVFVPRELIEYPPELESVINYVFGNSLICLTMEQADMLTYKNQKVNCRTVTLNGEDFNPRGILTGAKLDSLRPIQQRFEGLTARLRDLKQHLDAANSALKLNPLEILIEEIEHLESEVKDAKEIIENDLPDINKLKQRIYELEQQKKDENFQENEKRTAQNELANAKNELDRMKDTFVNAKERLASLRAEISALEDSIENDRKELDNMEKSREEKRKELEEFGTKVAEANETVKQLQADFDNYNKDIRSKDKAVRAKAAEISELKKRISQLENKHQSNERDAQDAVKNSKEFAKRVKQLEKTHPWIIEEKENFGIRGNDFDFTNFTFDIGKREIEQRKDRMKELSQTINTKAMHLLDTAEGQCQELDAKRLQLVKDKKQLFETIEQLDDRKKKELIAAHKQISTDFGSIYSTLLPGASAELVPTAGSENCLSGLEVKVSFNGKCKSISELSGGQRSLIALSLILSMLKFKPAPFYILDEIDAALDISHTENIGKMIKNHFSQSQFIVVSLKQGFFDNANVVYRVQFKDGRSIISRQENHR